MYFPEVSFDEIFRDSDSDDGDFEGFVFKDAQAKIVPLENSEMKIL